MSLKKVIDTDELELVYLLAFERIGNIGSATLDKLYRKFGSFGEAWRAKDDQLKSTYIQKPYLDSIIKNRRNISLFEVRKEIGKMLKENIHIITKYDDNYPKQLLELKYAPIVVFIKGEIKKEDENSIAIVGMRKPSNKAKDIARIVANDLAKEHITIVSGLARGIDTEAHIGALEGGGRTIAVIGTGFDKTVFYPPENFPLFDRITQNGCCISEFPMFSKGYIQTLFIRNRIISILSKGVLVIDISNSEHGGSLAQARYAMHQGRKVFIMKAIDEINSDNVGWKILKKEVKPILIENYQDIIREMNGKEQLNL